MRTPIFENDKVIIWKTVIPPGQVLHMHRHANSRIVVPLTDVKLKKVIEKTGKTEDISWLFGQAYYFDPDPVGEQHGDRNESNQDMEEIIIELK
jgi:hypothetical protein